MKQIVVLIAIIACLLFLFDCGGMRSGVVGKIVPKSEPTKQTFPSEADYEKERAEQENRDKDFLCSQLCRLLKELYDFQYSDDFHRMGFGAGGKYNKWLLEIEKYQKVAKSLPARFAAVKAAPGEIMQCGFDFMKSGGHPTDYTRNILPDIEKAIDYAGYQRSIAEIEAKMQK